MIKKVMVAAAATPRTTVDGWYADFLGRDAAEDPGSGYWVQQLEAGARPSDALWSITHSDEYNREEIAYSYAFYLSREPDAGARYWEEGANAQAFPPGVGRAERGRLARIRRRRQPQR